MITYERSAFGLNLLFRIHGSATYRSIVPALTGVFILWGIQAISDNSSLDLDAELEVGHPYAIGVVVSGITFLFVFRASQGYSRYWEAVSSVYAMQSKWMDATVHTASYHMQSARYNHIKPPSFFDYPELDALFLTRDRERIRLASSIRREAAATATATATAVTHNGDDDDDDDDEEAMMKDGDEDAESHERAPPAPKPIGPPLSPQMLHRQRSVSRSINAVDDDDDDDDDDIDDPNHHKLSARRKGKAHHRHRHRQHGEKNTSDRLRYPPKHFITAESQDDHHYPRSSGPQFLTGPARLDGNWSSMFADQDHGMTATFYDPQTKCIPRDSRGFASTKGGRTPPLFLQELAHLSSLMTAVAMATLRNDIDGAESPLDYYEPGEAWPPQDPGEIEELYASAWHRRWATFISFLGRGRTPMERTRYNAMRPLPVLGGVSNAEIRFLQLARGPYAKTQLCWHWLSEFVTREHLAGSLGDVGPPIISRIIQFLGDGMMQYNQGRKIMSIPFPFVHAQLSAFFSIIMIGLIPYLMSQYVTEFRVAAVLTFLSLICLSGIHEVARELENPFRNVPNELPVVTLMAEYNESLLTMYSGYHPDFFWEPPSHPAAPSGAPTKNNQQPDNQSSSRMKATTVVGTDCSTATATASIPPQQTTTRLDHHVSFLDSVVEKDHEEHDTADEHLPPSQPAHDFDNPSASEDHDYPQNIIGRTSGLMENYEEPRTALPLPNCVSILHDRKEQGPSPTVDNTHDEQLDQLRAIVLEQGRAMSRMLEEQARLNKLLEESLMGRTRRISTGKAKDV